MGLKEVYLGTYCVNENSEPYFIAEIGINHNGDLQLAKKLIDAANATQWNCVKFQKRTPDLAIPEGQKMMIRSTPWGEMTYLEYKKRIELKKEDYDYIDRYCKEKPIAWTASPWDLPSLEFLTNYEVPFIKIASATNTNHEILIQACKTKKPIILSTGMSTIEEVDEAVNILEKYSSGNYILLHTNSSYPTKSEEMNLLMIRTLKERYGCIVGYSGHEIDLEPSVIATSLGAKVIERHITLSHNLWGTDQAASLEIQGMAMLKRRISNINIMLGDGMKKVTESEIPIRQKLRGY